MPKLTSLFTHQPVARARIRQGLLLLGISLQAASVAAQGNSNPPTPYPQQMRLIAREIGTDGWLVFRKDLKSDAKDLLKKNKPAFGLEPSDELTVQETQLMPGGLTRFRYTQSHAGIPVVDSDFSIYARNGKADHATGSLGQNITDSATPGIDEKRALTSALRALNASRYAWQDARLEAAYRFDMKDSSATRYPVGKLVYTPTKNRQAATNNPVYRLAYRFEIQTLLPSDYWAVLIDARTGALFEKYSLREHCDGGTVNTVYNGTRALETQFINNSYRLLDYCRPGGSIATKYSGEYIPSKGWGDSNYIYVGNNVWNQSFRDQITASAHWGIQRANDFFWNTYQRKAGGSTDRERRIQVDHSDFNYDTFYIYADDKDYFHIGRNPNNFDLSMAELDVVAHEFTHSVARHSARLNNRGEAGALNESFADIFGLMTERSIYGNIDFTVGGRCAFPRSFANTGPSNNVQAQFFGVAGRGWGDPNAAFDNGWIHTNCGVQNRWFFLLCQGGSGDQGPVVPMIGPDKAARIAYNAMVYYLFPTANYAAARNATIQAARDLYGDCSMEVDAVIKAWFGVGVGDPAPAFCVSEINGTSGFCIENGQYVNTQYTVIAPAGSTTSWRWDNNAFSFYESGGSVVLEYIPSYNDAATLYADITYNGTIITRQITISAYSCSPSCNPQYEVCRGISAARTSPVQMQTVASTSKGATRDFQTFPNPVQTKLTVALPLSVQQITLSLLDSQGRLVQEQKVAFGERLVELNVSNLPMGIYLLKMADGSVHKTQRVQVTH